MDFCSLQHLIEQLQQKKAQAEASLVNLEIGAAFNLAAYYNYILHKLHFLANAGSSITDPVSYIRHEIARASVLYQEPLTRVISQAFSLQAIFPFVGENGWSQPVNNQEEMSGGVPNAMENVRQLAQQQITGCSTDNCETNNSPSNAEKSINSLQFNLHSNHDNQINMNEDDIANDEEQIGYVDAEGDGNGNLKEGKSVDNIETEGNHHYDHQESDNEGSVIDAEENGGGDSDHFQNQMNMSSVEDNDDAGEEQTAGPSTSNGQLSKHQIVPNRGSKSPINVKKTESLSIITQKLKCPEPGCKKVVKNQIALNGHLLAAHKLKKYRCLVRRCYGKVSTSFATQAQISDHLEQVHGSLTRWPCHCGEKFNSHTELNYHYRNYHELGQFACSKDGCTFEPANTRFKVLNHQGNHRNAKFECPVGGCDKSFNRKDNLTSHLFTHSGECRFSCTECDQSFKLNQHLTRHLRMHRNDKCFRCTWPQCAYSSTQRSHVITHIRLVHFKLPPTKKQQTEKEIEDNRDPRDYLAKD